ncbi:MAG: hypothetical protein WDA53_00175 [Bacillota bacterium]
MVTRQSLKEQSGLVLIEIVLSLLLISLVLMPLTSLFIGSNKIFSNSREMTKAIFLAQEILEESLGRDLQYLSENRDFQNHPVFTDYKYRVDIAPYQGNNLFKITVTLQEITNSRVSCTLSTIRTMEKDDY